MSNYWQKYRARQSQTKRALTPYGYEQVELNNYSYLDVVTDHFDFISNNRLYIAFFIKDLDLQEESERNDYAYDIIDNQISRYGEFRNRFIGTRVLKLDDTLLRNEIKHGFEEEFWLLLSGYVDKSKGAIFSITIDDDLRKLQEKYGESFGYAGVQCWDALPFYYAYNSKAIIRGGVHVYYPLRNPSIYFERDLNHDRYLSVLNQRALSSQLEKVLEEYGYQNDMVYLIRSDIEESYSYNTSSIDLSESFMRNCDDFTELAWYFLITDREVYKSDEFHLEILEMVKTYYSKIDGFRPHLKIFFYLVEEEDKPKLMALGELVKKSEINSRGATTLYNYDDFSDYNRNDSDFFIYLDHFGRKLKYHYEMYRAPKGEVDRETMLRYREE